MPTPDENKCCRQTLCVTLLPSFHSLVLDRDALSVAIVGCMDVLTESSDFSNEGYRFTAYRHCGKMDIWGGATGEFYHDVPPAPSETNTPVQRGYIQDSDPFDNLL